MNYFLDPLYSDIKKKVKKKLKKKKEVRLCACKYGTLGGVSK